MTSLIHFPWACERHCEATEVQLVCRRVVQTGARDWGRVNGPYMGMKSGQGPGGPPSV